MSGEQSQWQQLAGKLRELIAAGEYAPGDTVPPEKKLCETFGVSRTTVRRALIALTAEGMLDEGHGRLGRQVRDSRPLVFHATRSESLARAEERRVLGTDAWVTDAAEQGRKPGQALSVSIEDATPAIARWLGLEAGARVVVRHRLRSLDGSPHDTADSYYDAAIAEGTLIAQPADIPQGVIAYMAAELGHVQERYADEVTARMPAPDEAHRLRIPPGVPVIVQARTGHTAVRPVRVTVTAWPADRVRLLWEVKA